MAESILQDSVCIKECVSKVRGSRVFVRKGRFERKNKKRVKVANVGLRIADYFYSAGGVLGNARYRWVEVN